MNILHNVRFNKFYVQNHMDCCLTYELKGQVCIVKHTFVQEELRGQKIAYELASKIYHWAKQHHFIIQSECSYMTTWLKRYSHISK